MWLPEQGYEICRVRREGSCEWMHVRRDYTSLLMEYLALDWGAVNTEAIAIAMLRAIQHPLEANSTSSPEAFIVGK